MRLCSIFSCEIEEDLLGVPIEERPEVCHDASLGSDVVLNSERGRRTGFNVEVDKSILAFLGSVGTST